MIGNANLKMLIISYNYILCAVWGSAVPESLASTNQ